ncbi:hypothetical protein PQQ96_28450 [Paraburkholderia sediminicola]|uniref:hypothetical protein n=1 Tax=Paraburkholderia sediminicola TaxID=458836 RepID=UPI0038B89378
MSRNDASRLEKIVWEIRHVALHEGDALTIDGTILALADCLDRREDLAADDRRAMMQAAALLWRAGFNLSDAQTRAASAH